jgi:hypothetical protein
MRELIDLEPITRRMVDRNDLDNISDRLYAPAVVLGVVGGILYFLLGRILTPFLTILHNLPLLN